MPLPSITKPGITEGHAACGLLEDRNGVPCPFCHQAPGVIPFPRIGAEAHQVPHLSQRRVTARSSSQISLPQRPIDLPEHRCLSTRDMGVPGIKPVAEHKFIGVETIRQGRCHVGSDTGCFETLNARHYAPLAALIRIKADGHRTDLVPGQGGHLRAGQLRRHTGNNPRIAQGLQQGRIEDAFN